MGLSFVQVKAKTADRVGWKNLDELDQEQDDESGVKVEMYLPPDAHSQLFAVSDASDTRSNTSNTVFDCNRDYFLVYTLGKTGSSTLQASFSKLCGRYPKYVGRKEDEPSRFNRHEVKTQIMGEQVAKDFLEQVPPGRNVWILTMVRDPWVRIQSSFFENLKKWVGNKQGQDMQMQEIISGFHEYFSHSQRPHSFYIDWWHSFAQTTSVDIISKPFDFANRKIFSSEQINKRHQYTLLLRLEDIEQWPRILAPHFGDFELVPDNIAKDKWYDDLYEKFRSQLVWKQSEFDALSSAKELHVYTGDEIQRMKNSQNVSAD